MTWGKDTQQAQTVVCVCVCEGSEVLNKKYILRILQTKSHWAFS